MVLMIHDSGGSSNVRNLSSFSLLRSQQIKSIMEKLKNSSRSMIFVNIKVKSRKPTERVKCGDWVLEIEKGGI